MAGRAKRQWRIAEPDPAQCAELARRIGSTELTARVLINRGVADEASARKFLAPELSHLHEPSILPEFGIAAARILKAVKDREKIVVYGDYDVDGISATVILLRALRFLNADVSHYIPERLEEGYGLNAAAVQSIAEQGARLLVTVDCGISAVKEIALARDLRMDVIVTDHHEPGAVVPSDATLINPKLPGCSYPFRDLSGAGLAFKLAWALGRGKTAGGKVAPDYRDFLVDVISLAALGTIADVVPLHGENRVLASFGLRALAASSSAGIRALREAAEVGGDSLSAFDVAFKLAPRLNAAGRLGSVDDVVEMLAGDDILQARDIAARLNSENARRQRLQERILKEAYEIIQSGELQKQPVIVLAGEDWHPGVVGIVASRLVETYWRPVVMLVLDGDEAHGSARSIDGFHLHEALTECSACLLQFGGHARAAGLRMKRDKVEEFTREIEKAARARLKPEHLIPTLETDANIEMESVNRKLVDELARLAPHGEGNREPLFIARDVEIKSGIERMGTTGRHLTFWVRSGDNGMRAVAFGKGEMCEELEKRRKCSLAFTPKLNKWRGNEKLELDVRDIQVG